SMGGGGALWLGLTRPGIWAAIAPVCPVTPPGARELAGNALHVPVKMFQGELDPLVAAGETRAWYKALLEAGAKIEYLEYPGVRHNAWDKAYENGSIFDWFDQHQLIRYPSRVHFSARRYEYGSAYWVRLDRLAPGKLATIDAEYTAKNKLRIKTEALDAFTLDLSHHPMYVRRQTVVLNVDGTALRAKPADSISLSRDKGRWALKRFTPPETEKQAGSEGPISSAIASRHAYVYGTANAPAIEELKRRKAIAESAADWSTPRSRLMLNLHVLADEEATADEWKNSNLVLFGNTQTNSVIARIAGKLPLELNPGAADYGLVFTAPVDGRSVVVNSGLPWWTRADQARRPGLSFVPTPFRTLQSFGDYILFKGGLENVVVEGYFDRNWKLPPADAKKMQETGAVTVR
ncbi:MAG: hypothetical protein ACRD7E_32290, partial [Bryobacteraceae bacterium]